jgi:Cytochrome P460
MKAAHVFGLVLALIACGCGGEQPKVAAMFNESASLTGGLPSNPLQWKVVSSEVDTEGSTMSTLYGNEVAVQYARTHTQQEYPSGSVLSLVRWTQREDGRWFGAKIPNDVKSVEFVFVTVSADGRRVYSYQEYEGKPLKKVSEQEGPTANERAARLLSQRAAVMP